MAIYAIGDIQGCYDDLRRLLDKLSFNPDKDKLWFAGDLVNRGPQSLEVLRFVRGLGKRAVTVLGNHDLHLLAVSQGNHKHLSKDHTLDAILEAHDRESLIDWLRQQPLMYHHRKRGYSLVHAGLPPQWDAATALQRADEVQQVLRGPDFADLLHRMYGNEPRCWSDELEGFDRLRFIINAFTRLRFCDSKGNLALREKGPPGSQKGSSVPWFRVEKRRSRSDRILFGHWSTLGYLQENNVWSLDTGCLWGGSLTAIRIRKHNPPVATHLDCPGSRRPG